MQYSFDLIWSEPKMFDTVKKFVYQNYITLQLELHNN
jgi:hypothetical protein